MIGSTLLRVTVVVTLLVLAGGIGAAALPPDGVPTDTETPTETATPAPDETAIVDDSVRVTAWSFEGGQFVVTFDTDRRAHVQLQPSQQTTEGATQFSWVEETIPRGGGTVSVPADTVGGEAEVAITSRQSRQDQRGIRLSTGEIDDDPFEPLGGAGGLILGITLTALCALAAAIVLLRKEGNGVSKA